jgi:transcription elongation factor Elf1
MRGNCPKCGRPLQVVNTVVRTEFRIRYVGCRGCGHRPEQNTEYVPLQYAPRRSCDFVR